MGVLIVSRSFPPSARITNSAPDDAWTAVPPLMVTAELPPVPPESKTPFVVTVAPVLRVKACAALAVLRMFSVVNVAVPWAEMAPVTCWCATPETDVVVPLVAYPASVP